VIDMTASFSTVTAAKTSFRFEAQPPLSIVGLGYVGAVSAACFSEMAHRVVGVDLDEKKVASITAGRAPLLEKELDELTRTNSDLGRLSATTVLADAIAITEITFICVGTPSGSDGSVDLSALKSVARNLGRALALKPDYHLVVVRSTIPIGTTRNIVLPLLEAESGKTCGKDFGLCFHPEFLREGTAIADFFAPPKTVIGAYDEHSGAMLEALYGAMDAPLIVTSIESAEMVKYVDNTWHAVKVSFANEIGKLCQSVGVDSHEVMSIFVQDKKLNISPYYLRPGFAFGGSCLPKDVRAVQALAKNHGVTVPLIDSVIKSNNAHIEHAADLVTRFKCSNVAFLGVTFKPGTEDIRESPFLELMARLADRGCVLRAFDRNITAEGQLLAGVHAKTASASTKAILSRLPDLMAHDPDELLMWADIVVVCHHTTEFNQALGRSHRGIPILDLVNLPAEVKKAPAYAGICW
jgi:GDP-mannose 6-dehydrogenase